MKLCFLTPLAIIAAGALVLGARIGAGEKKDKKPDELAINDELINADLKDKVRKDSLCKTYTYKMTAGKTYLIDMKSRDFDSFLRLEDPDGTQVAEDDDSGGKLDARIVYRAAKTGEYTVCATSVRESMGKFTLTVKEFIIPSVALKLQKGQATHQGNLAKTDFRYRGQKPHTLYTIELEAGKTYQIDQVSKAFDAYLYLEDPDGVIVGEDDDSGGNLNARIIHKAAKTGKYQIIASTFDGGTGAFTLTVRQTGGDPPREEKKKD